MYFVTGNASLNKKKLLSAFLTDFIKLNSILFNLNLFEGKIVPLEFIPNILINQLKKMTAKDVFEMISFVDFMHEVEYYATTMKAHSIDSKKMASSFPNVDLSVYGQETSHYKELIFNKYPTTKYIYEYVLELRKMILNTKKFKQSDIEVVNFKEVILKLNKFLEQKDFQNFSEDFRSISSKELSVFISNRLLSRVSEEELPNFSKTFPTCIYNRKLSLLAPIYYQSSYSRTNGCLSDFSNYAYSLIFYNDLIKDGQSSYIADIKQLNNYSVLEKVLHLKDVGDKLQSFISVVVNKSFIKDIINTGNTNELIKLIDENEDFFYQGNNESIFIICLLLDVKKNIATRRAEIEKEIKEIIKKDIHLEFRLAELEIYIRGIIDSLLDNKRIQTNKDEISTLFYKSFNNIFYEIIYACFDSFIEDLNEDSTEAKGLENENK